MNVLENYPNCQTKIKNGIMSSVTLLTTKSTAIINEYSNTKSEGYCTKCSKDSFDKCKMNLNKEISNITSYLSKNIFHTPVVTTHTTLNWDYKAIGMVTDQSTTGTGAVTEFTSSFTDLFGLQSNRHNKKLKDEENLCLSQLRMQTLKMGANAVIGTDVDYSEIGSLKGILMVCKTGTSIKLNNFGVLNEDKKEITEKLFESNKRLVHLSRLN